MKIFPLAASASLLALAACSPPHPHARIPRTISSLDCPDSQGELTRKSRSPDGKSCLYAGENGEVSLQLVALNGRDAGAVLDPIEGSLRAEIAGGAAAANASGASADASATAEAKGASDKDRVDIDLPGIHVHARGDKDAKVKVGGVEINAGDNGASRVTVNGGLSGSGVHVDANDNGAVIHVTEPGAGIRRSVVLTSESPGPNGYRTVGYEARGPLAGPILVAVFKSRSDDRGDLKDDMRDLVRDNVGG